MGKQIIQEVQTNEHHSTRTVSLENMLLNCFILNCLPFYTCMSFSFNHGATAHNVLTTKDKPTSMSFQFEICRLPVCSLSSRSPQCQIGLFITSCRILEIPRRILKHHNFTTAVKVNLKHDLV